MVRRRRATHPRTNASLRDSVTQIYWPEGWPHLIWLKEIDLDFKKKLQITTSVESQYLLLLPIFCNDVTREVENCWRSIAACKDHLL